MRKVAIILLSLVLSTSFLWSFNDSEGKLNYISQPSNDPLSVTEIPKKWEKESAVIISQQYKFSYFRNNLTNRIIENTRRRIKLLDKAAVEAFSELYYIDHNIDTSLIINIIKPDNTIIIIDSRNAVLATAEVPEVFRSSRFKTFNYKKLAIPNLEPGDIIDYSYTENSTELSGYSFFLMQAYPIMHQSFEFIIDKSFILNFKAINGAPKIEYCCTANDYHGRERAIIKHYKLEDFDREKLPDNIWMNYYNDIPCIKFNASSLRSSATKDFIFQDSEDYVFSSNVDEAILKRAVKSTNMLQAAYSGGINITYVSVFLKEQINKGYSVSKAIELTYNQFRFYIYSHFYPFKKSIEESKYFNQFVFCHYFSKVLEKNNIDVDCIIAPSRYDGGFEKIASVMELNIGLRIQLDKEYYIFPFTGFSSFNEIPYQVEGMEAIVFEDIYKKNNSISEKIYLPVSKPEENTHFTSSTITINKDFESLTVDRKVDITGQMRFEYGDLYLNYISLFLKDCDKYVTNNLISLNSYPSIEATKKYMKKFNEDESDRKKQIIENIKLFYENNYEFSIKDYNGFNYNNENVDSVRKTISVSENFIIPEYIDQVGNDFSINIGSFTGKQVKIEADEQIRHRDIFHDYAKTYKNCITLNIPEGYSIANAQAFNYNIDNDSGSFLSVAKVNNNQLVIQCSKTYKRNFDSASNWSNYIEFTDAAYTFSQTKLILKRINN